VTEELQALIADATCYVCLGNGYLGARHLAKDTGWTPETTRSYECGRVCPECGGDGISVLE
jgi:hypothetical protein